jgi:hypothetical protein
MQESGMNTLRETLNTLLLVAILVALILIWMRMPPTIEDFRNVTSQNRSALMGRCPLVQADIRGTVDVNVENTPISVEIER